MKRGDVYVSRWGGRAIIEKVGTSKKRQGQVKGHFLGTGTRWFQRAELERAHWSLALAYAVEETAWTFEPPVVVVEEGK